MIPGEIIISEGEIELTYSLRGADATTRDSSLSLSAPCFVAT